MSALADLSNDVALRSLREVVRVFEATKQAEFDPVFPAMKAHCESWVRYLELDCSEPRDKEACDSAYRNEEGALASLLGTAPTTLPASGRLSPTSSRGTGIPSLKQAVNTWKRCSARRRS